MKYIFTFMAFIVASTLTSGQNAISYSYDSAGNRTGRNTTESNIALQIVEPQNVRTADNLSIISVRAHNDEVLAVNFTTVADFVTSFNTERSETIFPNKKGGRIPQTLAWCQECLSLCIFDTSKKTRE